MKILILCTGNSCRSQMAHGFLQSFDRKLEVFSAGTRPEKAVNKMAIKVMADAGVDISKHSPVNVNGYLNHCWDFLITVCEDADKDCPVFSGRVKNRLHIGFQDPSKYTGDEKETENEFVRVRDEIKMAFAKFYITQIKKQELPRCGCDD